MKKKGKEKQMFVETAMGNRYPINWIGESDLDNTLRFEIDNEYGQYGLKELFDVFFNPAHTQELTQIYDGTRRCYSGYSRFKGIEQSENKSVVVRLWPSRNKM